MSRFCCIVFYTVFLLNSGSAKWDGLKVKFREYNELPRCETSAKKEGWKMLSDCGDTPYFAGKRYVKDDDTSVVLLYDAKGKIAGIQAGFPKAQPNGYPEGPLKGHPFVLYEDTQYITAYFVDPATICSRGRTCSMFRRQGTGTDLYIQNGTNPGILQRIPLNEADLSSTKWTQGRCFQAMGMHYWYNVREDMPCDEFFPVFLLYTDGKLNAFGWAFNTDLSSSRYEHPPPLLFGAFLNPVPKCFEDQGRMSTMHIYLTEDPEQNICPN